MGRKIFQDGKTYIETSSSSYLPETTIFGNPKINLDFWGNPTIKTDMFGNQIVEKDLFGNPLIPVEYPSSKDIGSQNGTTTASGVGVEGFFRLLPFILLAGGLYSVFATMAGELIFKIGFVGILVMLAVTIIADYVAFIPISKGIQPPFYIFSTGWVFGITIFWIHFFYNMNFDVSNTNYLTWELLLSRVFPQMSMWAIVGITLSFLFTKLFRADIYAIRKNSKSRKNKSILIDMFMAIIGPPVLAVITSLVWCLLLAPIIAIFSDLTWSNLTDKQATVMAVVFVIFGGIVVIFRSYSMVKSFD